MATVDHSPDAFILAGRAQGQIRRMLERAAQEAQRKKVECSVVGCQEPGAPGELTSFSIAWRFEIRLCVLHAMEIREHSGGTNDFEPKQTVPTEDDSPKE